MVSRRQWRRFFDRPLVEWCLFALGILLVIAGFAIAPIPGPGGVFLIAPGLALILKTSMWAKRHYVRVKKLRLKLWRWDTTVGHWTDRALRRRSALRRERLRKEREQLAKDENSGTVN